MADVQETIEVLKQLDLSDYYARTLAHLLRLGRSKAPDISRESKVPKARIYEILSDLVDMGYVELFSGRPMEYRARSPEDILQAKMANERFSYDRSIESVQALEAQFVSTLAPVYAAGLGENPRTELLRIVRVGEASERETRQLYQEATRQINIISKVLEYLPKVEDELAMAVERGVELRILLLSDNQLSPDSVAVGERIVQVLKERIPGASIRRSNSRQPLRGSIIDPSQDYESGKAILLVEEKGTPLFLRDAAVTDNPSLVAAMLKYFEAAWEYESTEV
jgi:sugar-specific transcriptional regulator TrmB